MGGIVGLWEEEEGEGGGKRGLRMSGKLIALKEAFEMRVLEAQIDDATRLLLVVSIISFPSLPTLRYFYSILSHLFPCYYRSYRFAL